MYEIIIGEKSYQLNFGMGFVRDLNKRVSVPIEGLPGVTQNVGLYMTLLQVVDGSLEALEDVIFAANKGCNPRISSLSVLDSFFEDESTDIEEVRENILNFCRSANCTKLDMVKVDKVRMMMEAQENLEN